MPERKIIIEACEPMELMRFPTSERVWIRQLRGRHWPEVEIRGEPEEIHKFIELHWDKDVADQMVYQTGALVDEVEV